MGLLIKNKEKVSNSKVIFCLPYAGGGTSIFYNWEKEFGENYDVCPIQLPGREERISEVPYKRMSDMITDLIKEIMQTSIEEYVIFGHSMGGKVAYELEKALEKEGRKAEALVISGSRAPHILEKKPIHKLLYNDFKREIEKFGGTPKEILQNKEIIDFFMPTLRADFTIDETYYLQKKIKVKCPIIAIRGNDDLEATYEDMIEWKEYTENNFCYKTFEGGHFYIRDQSRSIVQEIKRNLEQKKS